MKSLILLFIFQIPFALIFFLPGCTRNEQVSLPMNSYENEVMTFNPHGKLNASNLPWISDLFNTLFARTRVGTTPELAENHLKYLKDNRARLLLKKNIRFNNNQSFSMSNGIGREIIARDADFSIKLCALETKNELLLKALFNCIKGLHDFYLLNARLEKKNLDLPVSGIKILSNHELEFIVSCEHRGMEYLLSHPAMSIIPREAYEAYLETFGRFPAGSGKFYLSPKKYKDKIVFLKNSGYKLGHIEKLKSLDELKQLEIKIATFAIFNSY